MAKDKLSFRFCSKTILPNFPGGAFPFKAISPKICGIHLKTVKLHQIHLLLIRRQLFLLPNLDKKVLFCTLGRIIQLGTKNGLIVVKYISKKPYATNVKSKTIQGKGF